MSIFEYDQEKHIRLEREEAWEEGRAAGIEEGKVAGIKEGKAAGIKEGTENGKRLLLQELIQKKMKKGKTAEMIAQELELSIDEIQKLM